MTYFMLHLMLFNTHSDRKVPAQGTIQIVYHRRKSKTKVKAYQVEAKLKIEDKSQYDWIVIAYFGDASFDTV